MTAFKIYFKDLGLYSLFRTIVHLGPALIAMGCFCYFTKDWAFDNLGKYIGVPVVIMLSAGVYFYVNKLSAQPEANELLRKITNR